MVETGGLENRCAGNRTGGSNPSPSASNLLLVDGFTTLERLRKIRDSSLAAHSWRTIGRKEAFALPAELRPLAKLGLVARCALSERVHPVAAPFPIAATVAVDASDTHHLDLSPLLLQ